MNLENKLDSNKEPYIQYKVSFLDDYYKVNGKSIYPK
jgi:hypothetical protein